MHRNSLNLPQNIAQNAQLPHKRPSIIKQLLALIFQLRYATGNVIDLLSEFFAELVVLEGGFLGQLGLELFLFEGQLGY